MLGGIPERGRCRRCAVDVQESLRTRNLAGCPLSRHMSYRIGITIGDIIVRDGDPLGDAVNIASRLEAIAPAGGICVSRHVYEAVANKISLKFADSDSNSSRTSPSACTPIRWRSASRTNRQRERRSAGDLNPHESRSYERWP